MSVHTYSQTIHYLFVTVCNRVNYYFWRNSGLSSNIKNLKCVSDVKSLRPSLKKIISKYVCLSTLLSKKYGPVIYIAIFKIMKLGLLWLRYFTGFETAVPLVENFTSSLINGNTREEIRSSCYLSITIKYEVS